jgi:cardiolipin synthase
MSEEFTSTTFYENATKIINSLDSNPPQIRDFPSRLYSDKGDEFYSKLWEYIDSSKQFCWILTYAMDSSLTANITFRKLSNAAKRGVDVVLFVDDLQQYTNKQAVQQLTNAGGMYVSLNPTWSKFWHIPTQEFFRRHHEKLIIIDDHAIIGSANLEVQIFSL